VAHVPKLRVAFEKLPSLFEDFSVYREGSSNPDHKMDTAQ
jgi:hypothetical protein